MAKTTKTTVTATGAAKPSPRRKTAPAAGAEKATTRRRTKSSLEAAQPLVAADSRPGRTVRRTKTHRGSEPTHEEISLRAYYVYLRRGGFAGSPEQDWQQAVEELRRERGLL